MSRLPKPDYQRRASDPAWLAYAAQFHGHLGPWATAGLRAGMAGRQAVNADGYFDVEVTAEGPFVKPPHSCFLDGLQVATGATWGKRNLHWVEAEKVVVRVKNTRTHKVAEVRPTPTLMKLLGSFRPRPKTAADEANDDRDHQTLEAIARNIAAMPQKEILLVTFPREL